jgi:hypothetical protein
MSKRRNLNVAVFSWNFGDVTKAKKESILFFVNSLEKKNDIIVVGLQEMSSDQIMPLVASVIEYVSDAFDVHYAVKESARGFKFNLLTLIIYRRELLRLTTEKTEKTNIAASPGLLGTLKSALAKTKGVLRMHVEFKNLLYDKTHRYTFVNVHLPFASASATVEAIAQTLRPYENTSDNVIVFGDFNSRSLVDDTCLEIGTSCRDVRYQKNVDASKTRILQHSLNKCRKHFTRKCDLLRRKLVQNDFIVQNHLIEINKFVEPDLYYLPSYKVNPNTSSYSLKKEKRDGTSKGRLTGYADRIVYSGQLSVSEYNEQEFQGNDHLPIFAIFKEKVSGGTASSVSSPVVAKGKSFPERQLSSAAPSPNVSYSPSPRSPKARRIKSSSSSAGSAGSIGSTGSRPRLRSSSSSLMPMSASNWAEEQSPRTRVPNPALQTFSNYRAPSPLKLSPSSRALKPIRGSGNGVRRAPRSTSFRAVSTRRRKSPVQKHRLALQTFANNPELFLDSRTPSSVKSWRTPRKTYSMPVRRAQSW